MDLTASLKELHNKREHAAALKASYAAKLDQIMVLYNLEAIRLEAKSAMDEAEKCAVDLKNQLADELKETGEIPTHQAIGVKHPIKYEISDQTAAWSFAEKDMRAALITTLDEAMLIAHVKGLVKRKMDPPDWIKITEETQITISQDLSKFFPGVP